jgi:ribosomal protein L11 methyltransferase
MDSRQDEPEVPRAAPRQRTCPYQDLYVYVMEGVVSEEEEARLGGDFLGNWVEETWSFLFFISPAEPEVLALSSLGQGGPRLLEQHHFTYEAWQGDEEETLRIGGLLIVPPWSQTEPQDGEYRVLLDPGVVFGNGAHPTTRDCLSALIQARDCGAFQEVLDLGTGTGILAIAAAALGARRVTAVDLNPLCVKTARKNVQWNGLDGIVEVVEGRAEAWSGREADVVIANLPHPVIAEVLEGLAARRVANPGLILSGLMRSEARDIRERLAARGWRLLREWDHEMIWHTFLAEGEG